MQSLGTGKQKVDYFSIDFWDSNIFLNTKPYPLGYFSVDILNWSNELITKLLYMGAPIFHAAADMLEHGLSLEAFEKAKAALPPMQELVLQQKPFSLLDIKTERKRTARFLSDECYRQMESDPQLFTQYLSFLGFYIYIPSDVANFKMAIMNLEAQEISQLKSRNEDGFARSCQQFFTDPATLMNLELHKPAPHFRGFEPMPVVQSTMVVSEHPSEKNTLTFVERMYFTGLMSFLVTEFFRALHVGHSPKQCPICKRYFLMTSGAHQTYCDGIDPNDKKGRTCRKVAAQRGRAAKEKAPEHPIKQLCVQRLNTIAKHKREGKISEDFAVAAKRLATDCRDRALSDHDYHVGSYEKDMAQEAIYAEVRKRFPN